MTHRPPPSGRAASLLTCTILVAAWGTPATAQPTVPTPGNQPAVTLYPADPGPGITAPISVAALAMPAVPGSAAEPAVQLLLRQAEHWTSLNRLDLAGAAIERALAADPANPQVLVTAVQVAVARGNKDAARGYFNRLAGAGASDAQRATAQAALRDATLDRAAIDQARDLARNNHVDEAAARYKAIFGASGPSAPYALEYYQTLSGSAAGRDEGLRGMAELAGRPDADHRAQLAFASALTYQTTTRADGIARLTKLAELPDVADEAQRAWRQALQFSAADPAFAPLLASYLQTHPQDTELQAQLQRASALAAQPAGPAASPAASLADDMRRSGFAQLEAGKLVEAGASFTTALANAPTDADALGGLGVVRLRQNKLSEAQDLLSRAIAADPASASKWQRALDGAQYGLDLADARTLLRRGDAEAADAKLRDAVRRDVEDRSDAEELLGEAALLRHDPAAAEQHFRATLGRRAGFAPAINGLNQALRAQGRLAELLPTPDHGPSGTGAAPANAEATRLRTQAAATADPEVAAALLRNAVAAAPTDPWARLDLARALRKLGRASEARALIEDGAAQTGSDDSLFAAALFAEEDNRPAAAEALVARIPPARRNPDMARLQARVRAVAEIARIAANLGTSGANNPAALLAGDPRSQLLAMAARPDPGGGTGAAVIRAFATAGDSVSAGDAARAAQAANPKASPAARLVLAGALLNAGNETDATAMVIQLEQSPLTAEQRRDIVALRVGLAIRASDRLNEADDQAAAFEKLRPVLAAGPSNVDARLALARLYQGAQQPAEALKVAETLLLRDPRNMDARAQAVEAAIAAGNRARARALVAEAQSLAPRDSRVLFLQARVARAFGDTTEARRMLADAAAQRDAELGNATGHAMAGPPRAQYNPFGTASLIPVSAELPTDALARQIAHESADMQDVTTPVASVTPMMRSRSGSGGLDKLSALSSLFEMTLTPPGIDGRFSADITPITLNAGKQAIGATSVTKFGSNAAFGSSAAAPQTTASGVEFAIAYARGDSFKFDLGTTPMGFAQTNFVGGVEFAPRLSDRLRLRVSGERRAVDDSLLSWAGMVDPITGQRWGMVTHSGGHAQLEYTVGSGYFYGGGGYQIFQGQNVASNRRIDGGAGYGTTVLKTADAALTTGVDLVYFGFDKALEGFTLGQGGYFSPQSYYALNVPVDYRGTLGDLTYRLGATAGYAKWHENAGPLYPTDAALQARVQQAAFDSPTTVSATQPAQGNGGFVGGVRIGLDYALTTSMKLSGGVTYNKAANWDETRATVQLQDRF
jgi:Tfp pilus assembly protein PilF